MLFFQIGRSRRTKQDRTGRFAALEKLKGLKGTKNKVSVDDVDNVYEEVDEKEYSKRVQRRQEDDWIIDDGEFSKIKVSNLYESTNMSIPFQMVVAMLKMAVRSLMMTWMMKVIKRPKVVEAPPRSQKEYLARPVTSKTCSLTCHLTEMYENLI